MKLYILTNGMYLRFSAFQAQLGSHHNYADSENKMNE